MTLQSKIRDLFELRKLPELCMDSKIEQGSDYYKGLEDLQKYIYNLDSYLESTWKLSPQKLDKYWQVIHNQLIKLGVKKSKLANYSRYILKYQKHEMQLRDGKLPIDYTLEYFYFYKSCDVKLIRQLIYDKKPKLNRLYKLSEWRLFDLITEFHDDIEDVYEDQEIYNGNSFLINLQARGLEPTFAYFQDKIDEVESRLDEKYQKSKQEHSQNLYAVTKEAIMHLNILLMNRKEEMIKNGLPSSKLLKKLSMEITV